MMMFAGFLGFILFGLLGWYIAKQTGQSPLIGFLVGGVFNLPGIAVLLVLAWLRRR